MKKKANKQSQKIKDGLNYENAVCAWLEKSFGTFSWFSSVWVEYAAGQAEHLCEFDSLGIRDDLCVCVEIKLTQTPAAIQELEGLYMPVATKLYPGRKVVGLAPHKFSQTSGVSSCLTKMPDSGVMEWRTQQQIGNA